MMTETMTLIHRLEVGYMFSTPAYSGHPGCSRMNMMLPSVTLMIGQLLCKIWELCSATLTLSALHLMSKPEYTLNNPNT